MPPRKLRPRGGIGFRFADNARRGESGGGNHTCSGADSPRPSSGVRRGILFFRLVGRFSSAT